MFDIISVTLRHPEQVVGYNLYAGNKTVMFDVVQLNMYIPEGPDCKSTSGPSENKSVTFWIIYVYLFRCYPWIFTAIYFQVYS